MKINKLLLFILLTFGLAGVFTSSLQAQSTIEEDQVAIHEDKVKDIVGFLEYVLNTLGNKSTSARDKDVIINESYAKIFRDSKVQIEDDLDENRDVVTNKDVQAYLKDVDFFFKSVFFDFNIEDISHYVNEDGKLFFKVSLTRNLRGVGIEGDSINNTQKRFIEVNLDPEAQDLKIASIYTHQYSRKEALARWWEGLSYEWQSIFKKKVGLLDSLSTSDIENIAQIEELIIPNHQYITSIAPLSELTNLRRVDISGTNIQDLKPIRNLTNLEELNISNTKVEDLSALKYASALRYLELQNTPVTNIETISRLKQLQVLDISNTAVSDLTPLASLKDLKVLNIAATPVPTLKSLQDLQKLEELNFTSTSISELQPIAELHALQILKADSTPVATLDPLSELKSLKVLSVNYTVISDLSPLRDLPDLERVYCDVTVITKADANEFMAQNEGVLVIFESDDLRTWWFELPNPWKNIFEESFQITGRNPTKEELAKITAIDSLNLTGTEVQTTEPLNQLRKLKTFIAHNSFITDLTPLKGLRSLEYLDISNTGISNFSPLATLENLRVMKANGTLIADLDHIMDLNRLTTVELDHTFVTENHVLDFLTKHPTCLVIYKSDALKAWWEDLNPAWKSVFSVQSTLSSQPSKEQLHKLVLLEKVEFAEAPITDLSPMRNFLRLKELRFSGTAVSDLKPIAQMEDLEVLQASRSPITSTAAVANFKNLKVLDISNTPIDDLKGLSGLYELRELNCSGTQIKRLKRLKNLSKLSILDCSNTRVRRLKKITHLDLKVLKCYNTRISKRKVEKFKDTHPECIVIYY